MNEALATALALLRRELEEEVILALFCIDPKTDQVFRYHDYGVNPETGNYICKRCGGGKRS